MNTTRRAIKLAAIFVFVISLLGAATPMISAQEATAIDCNATAIIHMSKSGDIINANTDGTIWSCVANIKDAEMVVKTTPGGAAPRFAVESGSTPLEGNSGNAPQDNTPFLPDCAVGEVTGQGPHGGAVENYDDDCEW